jgi:hypothetical protein
VFVVLGGWCLLSPASVLALIIRSEYRSDTLLVEVLIGAFGVQAILAGLFAAFAQFERRTFLVFGAALPPFFGFDYWAYVIEPILTPLGLLDVAGNIIMLALCIIGYRALRSS